MTDFKPLALRVPHQFDEPPPYFAARLAARNLRPARMFTRDMGLDFQRLADGHEENVRKLAQLGGADYQALIGCALRKRDGMIELKGQEQRKNGLRRARTHVCPKCLLEDIESSNLPPRLAIHGRANWMLASIRTCHIHEVALVEVARDVPVHDTHDWTTNVAPIVPMLPQFADSVIHRPASALELYLLDRLAGRPTASWLDAFPFFAAALVAELIGAVATVGKTVNLDDLSEDARYEAGHAGAEIANAGSDALVEFMTKLRNEHRPKKRAGGPAAVLGKLYMTPAQGLSDPAFDPLREVMGRFILNKFALGPGDELFGRPVTDRRFHTIRSASKEYGIHRSRLRKLIEAEGLISDLNAPNGDVLIDAQHADRIFRHEQNFVTMRGVARYLNAGRVQTDILFEADFIKRHCTGSGMKKYFLRPELDDFLSRLLAPAVSVQTIPAHAVDIATAARRGRCFIAEIVKAILDGKLTWVGRRKDVAGFASVLVDIEEIKRVTRFEDPPGLPLQTTAREVLKTSGPVLSQLISSGAIKTITAINPVNRCPTRFIPFDEIERFQSDYVSLHHLARSQGVLMPVLKKKLLAKGITPVNFAGVKATFYRRADVDPGVPSS
jgi:TniQ